MRIWREEAPMIALLAVGVGLVIVCCYIGARDRWKRSRVVEFGPVVSTDYKPAHTSCVWTRVGNVQIPQIVHHPERFMVLRTVYYKDGSEDRLWYEVPREEYLTARQCIAAGDH